MAITGHKTRDIFDRYNIVSDGDLKLAAKRIDEGIVAQTTTISTTTPLLQETAVSLSH
jgi:hypothetical protein